MSVIINVCLFNVDLELLIKEDIVQVVVDVFVCVCDVLTMACCYCSSECCVNNGVLLLL